MSATATEFESECREQLDRFFAAHPNATSEKRAHKALRLLRASEKPLQGKPEGWAAGIIYTVATDGRIPCGVPGVLNSEFAVHGHDDVDRTARVKELIGS